jgi:CDGSH-type Zn-finger protein
LEPDLVIEHREALIYLLYQAAEIEHGLMCEYLYAAFTLRPAGDPLLTPEQRETIARWRAAVNAVAGEEMLHLALVSNLLTALGAAPNFGRPQLPHPARHYPPGVQVELIPFGERALRHFLFLERPEGFELEDSLAADGLTEALAHAQPAMSPREIVPRGQQFATIGHLYRAIERGLEHLSRKIGEEGLFVGPPRAQAGSADFRWKGLTKITDLRSAKTALELIMEQGEGAHGDWRTAHFGRFHDVLHEYLALRTADPNFEAARPVLVADVRPTEQGEHDELITDPRTAAVVDLFNVAYEIMLQTLARYFTHTDETGDDLAVLAGVALALMVSVIGPLGERIPDLPVGPEHPGRTAGPSFELFYTSGYHLPHRHAAWRLLEERLRLAAQLAGEIELPSAADVLEEAALTLNGLADRLHAAADAGSLAMAPRDEPHIAITKNGPYVVTGLPLSEQAIGVDADGNSTTWVQLRSHCTDGRYALCRCGQSANKPFCDGTHAHVGFDGTETASRRSFAQDASVIDGPTMELSDDQPLCAFARFCDGHGGIWKLTGETDNPRTRVIVAQQASHCPSGRLVIKDKQQDDTILEPDLGQSIVLIEDPQQNASGPIWVRGGVRITSADGFVHETRNRVTLCRCGRSANKPFCDGTHAHIGFNAHAADDHATR